MSSLSIPPISSRNNNKKHFVENDKVSSAASIQFADSDDSFNSTPNWWNDKIAYKITHFLHQDLESIVADSPFLRNERCQIECKTERFPLFHRSEIRTGRLLGRGSFSDVHEIIGFKLDSRVDQELSAHQQKLRMELASNLIDTRTGRSKFAIKQLQKKLVREGSSIQDFHIAATDLALEMEYMSRLDHPNILSLRGAPLDGINSFIKGRYNSFFMIVDRLDETLDQRIRSSWIDEPESVDLSQKVCSAWQLANALEYLHLHRIVYRDLKPQNIGFSACNPDHLILFDFGLVRELPPQTNELDELYLMSSAGTRRYMAPEVFNDSLYNLKVDVYSWSMVFWEMLTYSRPYHTLSAEDHETFVCFHGERPRLFDVSVPTSIKSLLQSSWHADVSKRISMQEVSEELERIYLSLMYLTQHEKFASTDLKIQQHQGDQAPLSPRSVFESKSFCGMLDLPEFLDVIDSSSLLSFEYCQNDDEY